MRQKINDALKTAMRDKDQVKISTIRLILAALKDRDITAREHGKTEGIEDSEIISLMKSMIKQRKESSQTYIDAGREELAEREEKEIEVINVFLPEQMDDDEMRDNIEDLMKEMGITEMRDMGKVMGELKSRYGDRMDMAQAGVIVKQELSK